MYSLNDSSLIIIFAHHHKVIRLGLIAVNLPAGGQVISTEVLLAQPTAA
jgi:hypothetical protein